jgi:hypothetical protein
VNSTGAGTVNTASYTARVPTPCGKSIASLAHRMWTLPSLIAVGDFTACQVHHVLLISGPLVAIRVTRPMDDDTHGVSRVAYSAGIHGRTAGALWLLPVIVVLAAD